MKIQEILNVLEEFAPSSLQHSWDNSGLLIGNATEDVKSTLLCIDITEQVMDEAIDKKCNLIIAHHPLIFKGLKRICGNNYIERCVQKAIKHDIAIYAAHTNIDIVRWGVSHKLAEKLELTDIQVLVPEKDMLSKIVVFVPTDYADKIREVAFCAGAGHIGNYDCCSYSSEGLGSFRPLDNANPFVGSKLQIHTEGECRVEMLVPNTSVSAVLLAIRSAHPYEEPAIDILPLKNYNGSCGLGAIGRLSNPVSEKDFLMMVKQKINIPFIKHSPLTNRDIKTVALCGGSGADFIDDAKRSNADIYLTGDITHHRFFEGENRIVIADIGHFESEQFTKEIFYDIISKKIPNFAVQFSDSDKSTISYI